MKISNETKIGIMVVFSFVLLIVLTIKIGNFNFSKKGYALKVHFKNIEGVDINSPVMFNGFEVGIVDDVNIIDNGKETLMELNILIKNEAKIRDGVEARIKNLGFMGEKYIELGSGEKSGDYLKPGSIIKGKEPTDIGLLLENGKEISEQLKEITKNLNQRLEKNKDNIDEIFSDMRITMKHTSSISKNVDQLLNNNSKKIENTINNLNTFSINLEEMGYDLKVNPWKLLYRVKERKE